MIENLGEANHQKNVANGYLNTVFVGRSNFYPAAYEMASNRYFRINTSNERSAVITTA